MGFAKRNNLEISASFHLARAIQKSLYNICVDIHCISKEARPPLNILRPSATHRWRGNNVKHIGHDHTCTWLLSSTAMPCPLSFLTFPRMDSGLDSMAMPPLQTELHFEDSHLNGLRMFEGLKSEHCLSKLKVAATWAAAFITLCDQRKAHDGAGLPILQPLHTQTCHIQGLSGPSNLSHFWSPPFSFRSCFGG